MKIWKKFLRGGPRVHLELIGNASRYTHAHYAYVIAFIVYYIQVFSSHEFRITKEKEKEKETIKRSQQSV